MSKGMNRRQFLAGGATVAAGAALVGMSACSSGSGAASESASESGGATSLDEVTFVWEPNESTSSYDGMRKEVAKCIAKGAGVPCEVMTTTDYNVTIESLSSGKAQMASLGASEYVEVHAKNPAVNIAFVLSNDEGELDQASYYSQICVPYEKVDDFKDGDGYTLDPIKGKNFSFVNLNSTSGFVLPATYIKNQFGLESTDDLGESGKFFDKVLFPGSHPGSMANLLNGDADAAVFADYLTTPFLKLVDGEAATPGATYEVKKNMDAPLDKLAGHKFVVIAALPVPAVPICINTDAVPAEMQQNIIDYMCSDEVANDKKIFPDPDDTETVSNWTKTSDKVRFVPADDSYYDEFRKNTDFEG